MHLQAAGNIKESFSEIKDSLADMKESLTARSSRSADFIRDKIRQSRSLSTSRESSFHISGDGPGMEDGENPKGEPEGKIEC